MRDCRDIINEEETKQQRLAKIKHYDTMENGTFKHTAKIHFTRKPYTVKGKKI